MKTLALRLEGVWQSWGVKSRFKERGTNSVPTKSGVVGMLGAALGIQRGEDLSFLNALSMCVRIDSFGRIHADFQSVAHGGDKTPKNPANPTTFEIAGMRSHNLISNRYYLEGANFLVLMTGDDELVDTCAAALRNPRYALFLGRRNCPPSRPVLIGVHDSSPDDLLVTLEYPQDNKPRYVVRDIRNNERGALVPDLLVSNESANRTFTYRQVVEYLVTPPEPASADPFDLIDSMTATTLETDDVPHQD